MDREAEIQDASSRLPQSLAQFLGLLFLGADQFLQPSGKANVLDLGRQLAGKSEEHVEIVDTEEAPFGAAPAAQAFTLEGAEVPRFDLEEQAKNFRKGADPQTGNKTSFDTPLGKGTLEFGARPQSNFNSPFSFGPSSGSSLVTRQDFDRLTAPPSSQHLYDK